MLQVLPSTKRILPSLERPASQQAIKFRIGHDDRKAG
jgi:hypothetical protein